MNHKEIKEAFYKLLVENNALFNYLKYISLDSEKFYKVRHVYWVSFLQMGVGKKWNETDEGYLFWFHIHTKWFRFLQSNNLFQ